MNKSQSSDLGHYVVGLKKFQSKIDACIEGTLQNTHPEWRFHDHVWHSQTWSHEPETDLLELYRMRARQIREQYDYVILFYSGGSDSQTMVEAFFSAGCFIDEIRTVWSRKAANHVVLNPNAVDPRNIEAEYDLTTRPGLQWITDHSPQTKITYLDISDAVVDQFSQFDGEEWLQNTVEHLNPQIITRWSSTRDRDQLLQLDHGRRTAAVIGIDKPRVCIKDNRYHVYFVDTVTNSYHGNFNNTNYTNLETVFFYWSPDLPEIVIKQSHIIKKWFDLNPTLKPLINWPNANWGYRQAYEIITRSLVYPEWDLKKFQCNKTTSMVNCEWDDWFFTNYKNTSVYSNWAKGIKYVEQHVDRKYLSYNFDNRLIGFAGMINGHFALE